MRFDFGFTKKAWPAWAFRCRSLHKKTKKRGRIDADRQANTKHTVPRTGVHGFHGPRFRKGKAGAQHTRNAIRSRVATSV